MFPILLLLLLQGVSAQSTAEPPAEAMEWFRKADDLIGTPDEGSETQIGYLRRTVELAPDFAPAHFNLALILRRQGRLDEAIRHCDELIRIEPGDVRGWWFKGGILLEQGRYEEARPILSQAALLAPEDYRVGDEWAEASYRSGNFADAVEAWERILDRHPEPAEILFNIGLAWQRLGQLDAAAARYREHLASRPGNFQGRFLLGLVLRQQGKLEEARAEWLKAEQLEPDNPELLQALGDLYLDLEQPDEARRRLDRMVKVPAVSRANLGIAAKQSGDFGEAARLFRGVLDEDPDNALVWAHLGDTLAALDRFPEAADAYARAIALDPGDFDSHLNLGVLRANLGAPEEAARLLSRAVELQPGSGEAHFNLGIVQERLEQPQSAFEHYLKSLQLGYDAARLHFRVAVLYARSSDREKALEHLAKAFERDPSNLVPLVFDSLRAVTGDFDGIRYTREFNELMERHRRYWQPEAAP